MWLYRAVLLCEPQTPVLHSERMRKNLVVVTIPVNSFGCGKQMEILLTLMQSSHQLSFNSPVALIFTPIELRLFKQ